MKGVQLNEKVSQSFFFTNKCSITYIDGSRSVPMLHWQLWVWLLTALPSWMSKDYYGLTNERVWLNDRVSQNIFIQVNAD